MDDEDDVEFVDEPEESFNTICDPAEVASRPETKFSRRPLRLPDASPCTVVVLHVPSVVVVVVGRLPISRKETVSSQLSSPILVDEHKRPKNRSIVLFLVLEYLFGRFFLSLLCFFPNTQGTFLSGCPTVTKT